MKALILAAGFGSRLAPLTDNLPKSLVEVNGEAIMAKQINNLLENGVRDITVVSGYKASILNGWLEEKYPMVKVLESVDYASTNNMYSAYLAKQEFYGEAFLMMNADVFFDSSIITGMLESPAPNAVAVEVGAYLEESMKVVEKDGRIVHISKQITPDEAKGVSIDVYKFSAAGGKAFFDVCTAYIEERQEMKLWSEVALDDALKVADFSVLPIAGRWVEIDDHKDLQQANSLFA